MEVALLKRNTDCVYFLASPFTCKKGAECEYRHNDMARLNPRDCWYWLSGNCLNPTCAFRHPPLEVHTEASSEAVPSSLNQSSVPATKTTVPCYFYVSGFCNKGDRCPFLHDPHDASAGKPKMANTSAGLPVPPSDTKPSGKNDTGSAPEKKHLSPSQRAIMSGSCLQVQQKQQLQPSATNNIPKINTSVDTYVPEYKEIAAVKTVSSQPVEGWTKSDSEPSLGSDQCSEELVDGNIVREEWWESSPGFDVLVDGKTEDMDYEDEQEYLHAFDGNDGDNECLLMKHGYNDRIGYDKRGFYENDLSEHLDDEHREDLGEYMPRCKWDRKEDRILWREKKLLPVRLPVGGHNDVDLRDYLRKRRMVDGYMETHYLRHDVANIKVERRARVQGKAPNQRLRGRIVSKVERNGIGLTRAEVNQLSRRMNFQHNGSRQHKRTRKHQCSSEGQPRSFSKREKDTENLVIFSGPKSLAEIKEEKRLGHPIKNGPIDFEGPKPLGEILKDKKKIVRGC